MKKSFIYFIATFVTFYLVIGSSFAQNSSSDSKHQDTKGGSIKYEQVHKFYWNFTPTGNKTTDDYFAAIPRSQKIAKVLYFNRDYTLYEEGLAVDNEELNPRQKMVLDKMALSAPPNPELKKVYVDLKKSRRTELVELMTRFFLIDEKIEKQAWKPGTDQRKIQGYTCLNATLKKSEDTITAWFTPNIPISAGPENYGGLPGLILAIDINGQNVILATSVDLTLPKEGNLAKPKEGKLIGQKAFDETLAEKIAEFEKEKAAKKQAGAGK